MSEFDVLPIISPRRWVPHAEPESEYAEVIDTRARQVGVYDPADLKDITFEVHDERQGKQALIHFYQGQIIMEQL